MPCRVDDWGGVPRVTKQHGLAIEDFEAVLCGIFTYLEKNWALGASLDAVDWSEVGVSRKMVEGWWEAKEREKAVRRTAALAKLTAEDRKVLGL